jgi:hypothetical protein
MAHGVNLAKGSTFATRTQESLCKFGGAPESQQHVNAECTHPPLIEMRATHKRYIDAYIQCYRHQHIPTQEKWIVPLIDHMEEHMWSATIEGGDVWNGR